MDACRYALFVINAYSFRERSSSEPYKGYHVSHLCNGPAYATDVHAPKLLHLGIPNDPLACEDPTRDNHVAFSFLIVKCPYFDSTAQHNTHKLRTTKSFTGQPETVRQSIASLTFGTPETSLYSCATIHCVDNPLMTTPTVMFQACVYSKQYGGRPTFTYSQPNYASPIIYHPDRIQYQTSVLVSPLS